MYNYSNIVCALIMFRTSVPDCQKNIDDLLITLYSISTDLLYYSIDDDNRNNNNNNNNNPTII